MNAIQKPFSEEKAFATTFCRWPQSAVLPDAVENLHAADGLPEKQGEHAHIQTDVGLAGNQIAALHQGRESRCGSDHGGHRQTHQEVGADKELAVI